MEAHLDAEFGKDTDDSECRNRNLKPGLFHVIRVNDYVWCLSR